MPRNETELCVTCLHWNADAAQREAARQQMRAPNTLLAARECRSHPPYVLPTAQSTWPRTLPNDWCGDWEPD